MDGRELTYGEDLVGLDFNPSHNTEVHEIKVRHAKTIDELHELATAATSETKKMLAEDAIKLELAAQMAAVKAVTYHMGKD